MKLVFSFILSCTLLLGGSMASAGTANHEMKHDDTSHNGAHGNTTHSHGEGTIMVSDVVIRATTKNAGATAAYARIHNHGKTDDRLISASVSFAKTVEIHEMTLAGDVMKMRELADGLVIPAGKMVTLKKGAEHVMIMGLSGPIMLDERYQITFEFEKAGSLTIMADTITLSGKPPKAHKH